jgi:hypothetical protein|nr:MAG TPA: hypothetical protein [Caudoviricetes sp.]
MDIKGKIHCFFEQSGTFKNEFKKIGFDAEDYDIQNEFGETDNVIDLFAEIEKCYNGEASIFDKISKDDLILAFFPCIYFCATSQMMFSFGCHNYKRLTQREKTDKVLSRSKNREHFYSLLIKLISICIEKEFRLIVENPWSLQTYLKSNFVLPPTFVDNNRMLRGDYYKKPTAYWFVGCSPTYGISYQNDKQKKTVISSKCSKEAGVCSMERSMISPDYARNFIHDFILGKEQHYSEKVAV